MIKRTPYALFVSIILSSFAASAEDDSSGSIALFNGRNLDGLHIFVANDTVSTSEAWKVENGLLRCTGEGRGYARTTMAYGDYKLRLEWRWPGKEGNSGVMIHIVNGDLLWPKSIEAQLRSGRAGEFASFSDARSNEEIVSRNPNGVSTGRLPRPGPSMENPVGEWNVYEVVAAGETITLLVNGTEVNKLTGVKPSAGMIGFQAEGAAIDFRNIILTPLPPAKDLHAPMPK